MDESMLNQSGLGELLIPHLFCLLISMVAFWASSSHKKTQPLIQNYYKSKTESTANGLTNSAVCMAMVIAIFLFFVGFMVR